jgi:hypothetical protein
VLLAFLGQAKFMTEMASTTNDFETKKKEKEKGKKQKKNNILLLSRLKTNNDIKSHKTKKNQKKKQSCDIYIDTVWAISRSASPMYALSISDAIRIALFKIAFSLSNKGVRVNHDRLLN